MKFIKLHWFERKSSFSDIIYKGEIAISIDEITFVEVSDIKLKSLKLGDVEKEYLSNLNKDGKLSIVHTKIYELEEFLVVETVKDIFDFIR